MDDGEALGIHHGKDSFALVYKSSVENEIANNRKVRVVGEWRVVEPVFDDPSDRRDTVTALLSQLSHGVALRNPPLEPDTLTQTLVEGIFPAKRATTLTAKPTLCPMPAFSVASYLCTATPWTMLFLSSKTSPLLNAVNYTSANMA